MSNTFNFYGNININIDADCNDKLPVSCNANINSIVLDFATGLIFNIEGSQAEASKLLFFIANSVVATDCVENINSITMELNKVQNLVGNSGIISLQMTNVDCNEYLCNRIVNYKTEFVQIPQTGNMTFYSPKYLSSCNNRTFTDLHSTNIQYVLHVNGDIEIFPQLINEGTVIAYYATCEGQVDNLILLKISNNNCPPSDIIATRCEGTTYITTLADGNCGTYEKTYPNHENCI